MLNKKGIAADTVKNIILVVISLILMLIVINQGYIPFLTSAGTKKACQNWVDFQSTPLLKEFRPFKSPCVTTEDTIEKNVKNKEKIYEQLANNMYDCWDMYGRGERDFYKYLDWSGTKYCRVCSEIKVNPDLDESKRNLDIDEFEEYLTNHNIPNRRETYAEFFTKIDNAKLNFGSGTMTLDQNKRLYTFFTVYKKSQSPNFFQEDLVEPSLAQFSLDTGGCIAVGFLGAKAGFLAGSIVAPVAGTAVGTLIGAASGISGCLVGIVVWETVSGVVAQDYYYPSIILLNSETTEIQNACDYVYYKPLSSVK